MRTFSPDPVHTSDRGRPLVTGGRCSARHTVLTVESYIKWYDIYTVTPAGRVGRLGYRFTRLYEARYPGWTAWSDHVPTPLFCRWLHETYSDRFEWDAVALDTIAGRWLTEGRKLPEMWHWLRP